VYKALSHLLCRCVLPSHSRSLSLTSRSFSFWMTSQASMSPLCTKPASWRLSSTRGRRKLQICTSPYSPLQQNKRTLKSISYIIQITFYCILTFNDSCFSHSKSNAYLASHVPSSHTQPHPNKYKKKYHTLLCQAVFDMFWRKGRLHQVLLLPGGASYSFWAAILTDLPPALFFHSSQNM